MDTDIISHPYFHLYKTAYEKVSKHISGSDENWGMLVEQIRMDLSEFLWPNATIHDDCLEFDYAFDKETFLQLSKKDIKNGFHIIIAKCRNRNMEGKTALKDF